MLARNHGFNARELILLRRIIQTHRTAILEAWYEHCGYRVISVPLAWSWRLSDATPAERKNFRLIGPGYGIHWPDLDEDISVEGLLHGIPARRPNPGSQVLRSADAAPRHKRAPSARRPASIR